MEKLECALCYWIALNGKLHFFCSASSVNSGIFCTLSQNKFFTAILYHDKTIKNYYSFNLQQKYIITSTETASPENFTLTASPVFRLLTPK